MTRRHRRTILALAAASLVLGTAPASATECTARACTVTNTVRVHVGTILKLAVQGSPVVIANVNSATVRNGSEAGAGPSAIVRSNGPWKLHISAAQEVWSPLDNSARTDKPAADLTWSTHASDDFSSLSVGPVEAARGGPTGGTTLPLYYRTRIAPAADTPGGYLMVVRLTLVGA